jgi:osmoprotectant transport system substrate-binding protein
LICHARFGPFDPQRHDEDDPMTSKTKRIPATGAKIAGLLAGAAVATVMATASVHANEISVGSKIDTEGALLGNMIAILMEDAGFTVDNKVQLGGTSVVRQALLAGELDIYPEYTGNGAFFFNREGDEAWNNRGQGYELVSQLDADENDLIWLTPAPANNTWALAVRQDVAAENGLETMEDFGAWAAGGGDVMLAASAEFVESPNALPAFQSAYGFELTQDQMLVLTGGDTAATIRAAAEQTNGTNTAMVYGTDGALAAVGLVVMEDTLGVQMVYEPAPVIRAEVLEAHPEIRDILDPVFETLDLETLQRLNASIIVDGLDAGQVARGHLEENGFLN